MREEKIKSKKIFLLFLAIIFLASTGLSATCSNEIRLDSSGTTQNNVAYTISPEEGYYYPRDGLRAVSIPRRAENVEVTKSSGETLEFEVKNSSNLNKRIRFWNDENVYHYEEYTFNITYEVPRGAVIYGQSVYFNQIIPFSSCETAENSVDFPDDWVFRESSAESYDLESGVLSFGNLDQNVLRIWFNSSRNLNSVETYQQGIFNVTAPSTYSERVKSQVGNLNSFLPAIEDQTGIETPNGFDLHYLRLDSGQISEEAAGQYYGGRIEIKSTQLAKNEYLGLEVLIHEVVHGYNDRFSSGSPDWWWEEGTANYVAHKVLRDRGYNTSIFFPSGERINATFENCDYQRNFISDWSPIDESTGVPEVELAFPCGSATSIVVLNQSENSLATEVDYIDDKDTLGYRYSELIVSEIFENSDAELSDVYGLMSQKNVTFSNSTDLMNNQINYFASKATGQDLTEFLDNRGVESSSWKEHEEKIQTSLKKVNGYQSRYNYSIFEEYIEKIRSIREDFYYGNFDSTSDLEKIRENARERNETVGSILSDYRETNQYIRSLESNSEIEFYDKEIKELEKSIDYLRNSNFKEATQKIEETREAANNKNRTISEYRSEKDVYEQKIESAGLLVEPFMFGADKDLKVSEDAYERGKIYSAGKRLDEAKSKSRDAKYWASIFYLLCLGAIIFLIYRKKF